MCDDVSMLVDVDSGSLIILEMKGHVGCTALWDTVSQAVLCCVTAHVGHCSW